MVKMKRMMAGSVDENMEQFGILTIAGVIAKWCKHFGKQFDSLTNLNIYLPYDAKFHSSACNQEK